MYQYILWSIWPQLSILYRLFALILAAVTVHSFASATITLKRIRGLTVGQKEGVRPSIQNSVLALHSRCTNMRQILGATFYLFGFLFFIGLQNAPITLGDGPSFPMVQILGNFVLHFVFSANVFLVFLVLHLVQWLVSSRLNSCVHNGIVNPTLNFP
jgi:hypothetical protein